MSARVVEALGTRNRRPRGAIVLTPSSDRTGYFGIYDVVRWDNGWLAT